MEEGRLLSLVSGGAAQEELAAGDPQAAHLFSEAAEGEGVGGAVGLPLWGCGIVVLHGLCGTLWVVKTGK